MQLRYDISRILPQVDETGLDLIVSSLSEYNPDMPTAEFFKWRETLGQRTTFDVKKIPLAKVEGWYFDEHLNFRHRSGKFFSIEGIRVQTNHGYVHEWSQPIIQQPEVGILGILCQKRNGVLHFLMQAKIEPGNVNQIQLSPTIQATRSNYTQVHHGHRPPYLDYFVDLSGKRVIVDQLQSEQGARFLKKRNRNMIVEIPAGLNIDLLENYCWLTLGQIKKLMQHDNIVNMDARTVLSCTQLRFDRTVSTASFPPDVRGLEFSGSQPDILLSLLVEQEALYGYEEIISWFTALKTFTELDVKRCNIDELDKWRVGEWEIAHVDEKFFRVIGVEARIGNREVSSWCQPLVEQRQFGLIGFILKKINGVYHLLVQAKLEAGNFDVLEMAPTVQCVTGSYQHPEWEVPYLEYFAGEKKVVVHYDRLQSEEGGRFYCEQNRNMVIEVEDDFPIIVERNYTWMTLRQVKEFIKFNNYFNIEARSLLACISVI